MAAEKVKRASYTLEYKLEAVRLVRGGQSCAAVAKVLGIPSQTLENWVRQAAQGQLTGAGVKLTSAEQMELTRLRADLARVKMERDILKKALEIQPVIATLLKFSVMAIKNSTFFLVDHLTLLPSYRVAPVNKRIDRSF